MQGLELVLFSRRPLSSILDLKQLGNIIRPKNIFESMQLKLEA
jgi:hypothetical protein